MGRVEGGNFGSESEEPGGIYKSVTPEDLLRSDDVDP